MVTSFCGVSLQLRFHGGGGGVQLGGSLPSVLGMSENGCKNLPVEKMFVHLSRKCDP